MSKTAYELSPDMWRSYRPFYRKREKDILNSRRAEALKIAYAVKQELGARFRATRVMLFGSLSRSDFRQYSDIDIAVWGISPTEFYKAVAFVAGISKNWEINLVDADDCSPSLLDTILKEGIEL
jgi:predicted nucleotidyltransferase